MVRTVLVSKPQKHVFVAIFASTMPVHGLLFIPVKTGNVAWALDLKLVRRCDFAGVNAVPIDPLEEKAEKKDAQYVTNFTVRNNA